MLILFQGEDNLSRMFLTEMKPLPISFLFEYKIGPLLIMFCEILSRRGGMVTWWLLFLCHQNTKTPNYTKAFCEVLCFGALVARFFYVKFKPFINVSKQYT
jgi:hypothetical protein